MPKTLPADALALYDAALASAKERFPHNPNRQHRIAWGAVKRSYTKRMGRWTKKR